MTKKNYSVCVQFERLNADVTLTVKECLVTRIFLLIILLEVIGKL